MKILTCSFRSSPNVKPLYQGTTQGFYNKFEVSKHVESQENETLGCIMIMGMLTINKVKMFVQMTLKWCQILDEVFNLAQSQKEKKRNH